MRIDCFKHIILTFSIFLFGNALAQGIHPAGSRSLSMANASNTFVDVWSHMNNPGAVANIERFSAGLHYENRYLLKELQTQGFATAIPLRKGVLSVGGNSFGFRSFRTTKLGVGYGLKLSEHLSLGVQLNYLGLTQPENYGNKHSVSGEVGLLASITDNWKVGFSANNIGRARLIDFEDDRFSTRVTFGTSYHFSESFLCALEVEKILESATRVKAGIEYQPMDNLFLRAGFATARPELSFGLGYDFGLINLAIGSAYDQVLGWSPNFTIQYEGGSDK